MIKVWKNLKLSSTKYIKNLIILYMKLPKLNYKIFINNDIGMKIKIIQYNKV